jgi:RNA-directed DNA polymerase
VNIGDPWPDLFEAESEVLTMQTKLHRWATDDPDRRFDDLYNLVYDPAFLVVAWNRVRGNKGARTAGVDGVSPRSVVFGAGELLDGIRDDLKSRRFAPVRVREKAIPKASGKIRRLGDPDRHRPGGAGLLEAGARADLRSGLQAVFLWLPPEASSPGRHRRDSLPRFAQSELRVGVRGGHHGVLRRDRPCGPHGSGASSDRRQANPGIGEGVPAGWRPLRGRQLQGDDHRHTPGRHPLAAAANIALSVLDEHFVTKYEALGQEWTRSKHRRAGGSAMRLVRYADDFVVMVAGSRDDTEALWGEVGGVLAPMGLRLSVEKTRVCHIDEGFDFLGWRIQRQTWRSRSGKRAVYTYPSKKALASVMDKVRKLTRRRRHRTLADLLRQLNPVLRGWCNYFRHGVSSRTFGYLDHFAFWRVVGWLRKRHVGLNMGTLVRRFLPGWQIRPGRIELFRPEAVEIIRYRYRGTRIPTPWACGDPGETAPAA